MADTLTWTAYNSSDNIKKIYFKWAGISVLHNWIDEADYQAAMAEKDAEYDAMVAEKDQAYEDMVSEKDSAYNTMVAQKDAAYNAMVAEKNAQIADASAVITYSSGTNYNRDGNMTGRYRWDWALNNNYDQRVWPYSNPIRFENSQYYVFWWFCPISWSTKWSNHNAYVSPFEYFTIDKSTKKMTRWRWWVNWIQVSCSSEWEYLWVSSWNLRPSNAWREYPTEYRTYYYWNNYSKNYSERNWNTACYFYIKKDLSAMWYVAADDVSWRNSYWVITTNYNTEWNSNRTYEQLFSNYNTDYIWNYNVNVKYLWKLYTATWYCFYQNSWNDWYGYGIMYTVSA